MDLALLAALGFIAAAGLFAVLSFNRLIALRQRCDQAFADIDVQLKQRHDLVPQLIETVRGYSAHENATLEAVVRARSLALRAEHRVKTLTKESKESIVEANPEGAELLEILEIDPEPRRAALLGQDSTNRGTDT